MIILTRLGGHSVAVNPDLIERAEPTPDTVLTMLDGHKIVVAETIDDVVDLVRTWRATVVAQAYFLGGQSRQAMMRRHPSQYVPAARSHGFDDEPDGGTDRPAPDDELSEHVAVEASLAQVLRLPQRGE